MADQRLNIIFSGDASQLNQTISKTEEKLTGLQAHLKQGVGGDSFKQATDSVRRFEAKLGGLTTGSIAQLRRAAALLKAELANLSPSQLKAPVGDALSTSLNIVTTRLKTLEKQANITGEATSGAFSKAFGGVRQLANILPGLGIAGVIGLAVTAVDKLTNGFFESILGADKFSKAIDEASKSIDTDSVKIIGLVKAMQSGTLTTDEFRRAKAKVIEQAPEFQNSFEGDRISIEASNAILTGYIDKLVRTVRVTAALQVVNETLAKSIRAVAKGEDISFGEMLGASFRNIFSTVDAAAESAEISAKNVQKAIDNLKPENISKLFDETFKSLGITFKDFAGEVDDGGKSLDDALAKQRAAFDKFASETITKARQFTKEFGGVFIVPDLEENFFTTKQKLFADAQKLLNDISAGNLKLIPTSITAPVKIRFDIDDSFKENFDKIRELQTKIGGVIPKKQIVGIVPGVSEDVEKRNKVFFDNFRKDIEATSELVSSVLTPAFQGMFDSILAGENPLKSFFQGIVESINQVISRLITATIQAVVLSSLSGGGISFGSAFGKILGFSGGGIANPSRFGSQGGSLAGGTLTSTVRGTDLVFVLNQGQKTVGRVG